MTQERESTEEYIESIYKMEHEGKPANLKRLADSLNLTPTTVFGKVKKLVRQGLAEQTNHKGIMLTEEGEKQAIEVIRKHRLAEKFLVDVLGIPWEEVHEDACRFEHIMSDRVADALEGFLKHPSFCPHGHPIPDKAGKIKADKNIKLSEMSANESCEIIKVAENSPELLRYLAALKLFPNTTVKIEQVAPFNGAFLVRIGDSSYALGREIADKIWVQKGK